MTKYTITINRSRYESADIQIEANSTCQAIDKAMKRARSTESLDWQPYRCNYYKTDVVINVS